MSGTADVRLTCQPNRAGNVLVFPYRIENQGAGDIFVMDATPALDPTSREAQADPQAIVAILGADGDARIGKFIAPLPPDRAMQQKVIPLARRLQPGEALERQLVIPHPLAECGPYHPELPLRQYEPVDLAGVVFIIGYWPANAPGLMPVPVAYAPGLLLIHAPNPTALAVRAWLRFPVKGLQIFKRRDAFAREVG